MAFALNHIVSAGYIRNWAGDGELVGCQVTRDGRRTRLPPRKLCARTGFYNATPDPAGATSAAIAEKQRNAIETAALPLIASLEDAWPLSRETHRAKIALWMAMTHVGSPAWRGEFPESTQRFWDDVTREAPAWFARHAEREKHELREPDFWLWSMFLQVAPIATVLGMMHWTLVTFAQPLLVSGDHPISYVPLGATRAGATVRSETWFLDSVEVRMPVSPTAALLLTWADRSDIAPAEHARRRDAAALNHAIWTHADPHVFWSPLIEPVAPKADERFKAVSSRLVPGYGPTAAATSVRRSTAVEWFRAIDEAGHDWERMVATMHRDDTQSDNPYRIRVHGAEIEDLLPGFPDRGRTSAPP